MPNILPVRKKMCDTCPYRPGSKLTYLVDDLNACAAKRASRICHSTGKSVIKGDTKKPESVCRGSRDVQLKIFHAAGVITAPTDEAWAEAAAKIMR